MAVHSTFSIRGDGFFHANGGQPSWPAAPIHVPAARELVGEVRERRALDPAEMG
jgi:hypothetical protein